MKGFHFRCLATRAAEGARAHSRDGKLPPHPRGTKKRGRKLRLPPGARTHALALYTRGSRRYIGGISGSWM